MSPADVKRQQVDETERARLIACDTLLHVAPTGRELAFSHGLSPSDLGLDLLRLLLRMLDASEINADNMPVVEESSAGKGRDCSRPSPGRFDVAEHLGWGGIGFVVRARDQLLGREFALKMPLPERVLSSGDVRRFLREAQSAARLDHPNIVRVYDAGEIAHLGYASHRRLAALDNHTGAVRSVAFGPDGR